MYIGDARSGGRVYGAIHFCPPCWLKHIRIPLIKLEQMQLENIHGWRTVAPVTKQTLLTLLTALNAEVELMLAGTEGVQEDNVEYDGYGDEFFIQDN